MDISEQPVKSIFECGADLDGDIFYYKDPKTGELIPVMINHMETWLDGFRSGLLDTLNENKEREIKQ